MVGSRRLSHGLALTMAAVALALLTWGLGRPALWLDESASVVATQRTWADLLILTSSTDAPLVPYYAVLKAASSAVTAVAPGAAVFPEVLFRWPSAAVSVLAVWALTLWLARRCSPELAISAGVLLLATASFSRYAQEARPYAFVVAAAVAATILWTRMVRDPRRRWVLLYAVAVAVLVAAHLLAATLVVAHLVAATVTSTREHRRSVVLRTATSAALGFLLAAPLAVPAARYGQGPRLVGRLPDYVPAALVDTLAVGGVLALGLGLASAGALFVVWVAPPRYRSIARLAAAWAVVPLLVVFPLILIRPNLLAGRYLLFVLPGWAILGGVALVTLLELVRRALTARPGRTDRNGSPRPGPLVATATYGMAALLLAAVVAGQLDALREVRSSAGHGEDIRPALAAADRAEYADLPIVVAPPNNSLEVAAYARQQEHRLVGVHVQRNQRSIWSPVDSYPDRKEYLRRHDRVVVLAKVSPTGDCRWRPETAARASIDRCLPRPFRYRTHRVEAAGFSGGWIFAVLTRHPPGG